MTAEALRRAAEELGLTLRGVCLWSLPAIGVAVPEDELELSRRKPGDGLAGPAPGAATYQLGMDLPCAVVEQMERLSLEMKLPLRAVLAHARRA